MVIEIITSESGDWGVCRIGGVTVSEGHDVRCTSLLKDILFQLDIALICRQISDKDMEEGNY